MSNTYTGKYTVNTLEYLGKVYKGNITRKRSHRNKLYTVGDILMASKHTIKKLKISSTKQDILIEHLINFHCPNTENICANLRTGGKCKLQSISISAKLICKNFVKKGDFNV
jgi:hypothetical protein